MKFKAIVILAGSVALLSSCSHHADGDDTASKFAKKWELTSVESQRINDRLASVQKMMDTTKDSAVKAMLKQSLDEAREMTKSMVKETGLTTLNCKADGSCEISVMGTDGKPGIQKGMWMIVAEGKKVVMKDEKGLGGDTMNIEKLTADSLTISGPDGKGSTASMTYKAIK